MDVDLAPQCCAKRELLRFWLNELVIGLLGHLHKVDISFLLFFRNLFCN